MRPFEEGGRTLSVDCDGVILPLSNCDTVKRTTMVINHIIIIITELRYVCINVMAGAIVATS